MKVIVVFTFFFSDVISEKTKLRNPNNVLQKASMTLLKILFLCSGIHGDMVQKSCIQNMSHYLRFNLEVTKQYSIT